MISPLGRILAMSALCAAPVFAQDPTAGGAPDAPKPPEQTITPEAEAAGITTPEARTSYAIGLQVGKSLKNSPYPLDMEKLVQGIQDTIADKAPALTQLEVQELLTYFGQQSQMNAAEAGMSKASSFLEENKAKEGWKTTESGLQYKAVKEGEGANPKETDKVKVHYRGTLTDGTVFDSSYDRGQPATFGLNQVIPGWTEGLQLMKPGAKYEFAIPPDLAYGPQGQRGIPANSVLLFEVELLEIVAGEEQEPGSVTINPTN